ncbi:hypothetical protein GALMADRAFT_146148 [Galerina marginata CBS 339.88]|uniref:Uncharacterized protein n=1 Tax=Galerina marginata (strain CBS 339.88) TaxID=685588 RepID=A0A067SPV2_GALM3|nr:hypothetical protein GALMADRAFT_146148 [Galerina marginata CBS 339.88]
MACSSSSSTGPAAAVAAPPHCRHRVVLEQQQQHHTETLLQPPHVIVSQGEERGVAEVGEALMGARRREGLGGGAGKGSPLPRSTMNALRAVDAPSSHLDTSQTALCQQRALSSPPASCRPPRGKGEEERASGRNDGAGIEPASPRERPAMWNDVGRWARRIPSPRSAMSHDV